VKFYQISNRDGAVVGCETSLQKAKRHGRDYCGGEYDVDVVITPPPSRELVRVLLASGGGYAIESYRVIENGKPYGGASESDVEEDAETEARERAP
jgi:hypothetical protein